MNIVLFTRIKPMAGAFLEELAKRNIKPAAIFIERRKPAGVISRMRKLYNRQGIFQLLKEISAFTLAKLGMKRRSEWTSINYYRKFCDNIRYFDSFNSPECIKELKAIPADIVLLAGAGILKAEIINSARMFFINAHPGLLPYYRGVDVLQAAILNGDAPYVTVHKVDSGVDTGAILDVKEIPIEKGETFDTLRAKAIEIAKELACGIVEKYINSEHVDEKENLKEKGKHYFMMKKDELKKAKEQLRKIAG